MEVSGQRRAKRGGEFGPNGEWYEGGKFIATSELTRKSSPYHRPELSDEEKARRAAEALERDARAAKFDEWLSARRARFAETISYLTSNPGSHTPEMWAMLLETGHAGFLPSLGRDLHLYGRLSEKQARYVTNAMIGRQTKKNLDEWYQFFDSLVEEVK
jgi:hypothetical protein